MTKHVLTPVGARLYARGVEVPGPLSTPCLLWGGATNKAGYGVIGRGRVEEGTALTHVVAWELERGPVPPETPQLDHLCNTPACFRVDHLEPVTDEENKIRARERRGWKCRKNLHVIPIEQRRGGRCVECRRAGARARYERKN